MRGVETETLPLFAAAGLHAAVDEAPVRLPTMAPGQRVAEDYRALRLSLKAHPLALLRPDLVANDFIPCGRLGPVRHGRQTRIAGLVTARQRPGSAKGVVFITIEDETGVANLIVWPAVFEQFRQAVLGAKLIGIQGAVQREGQVVHVVADRVYDLSALLGRLDSDDPSSNRSGDTTSRSLGDASRHSVSRPPLNIQARNFH